MSFKPIIIDQGQLKQLPAGQALNAGGWTLPAAGGTETHILIADAGGNAAWTAPSFGHGMAEPTLANQVYMATGAGAAAWTTDPAGLTSLNVDNVTIDGTTITSDTGTISFDDENLTTTGQITSGKITATHSIGDMGTPTGNFIRQNNGGGVPGEVIRLEFHDQTNLIDGTGPGIDFDISDSTAGPNTIARIAGRRRNGNDNSGSLDFYTSTSGASIAAGRFEADGTLTLLQGLEVTGAITLTGDVTEITSLTVDNITIDGAAITSDTGAISFDNENLSTTGTVVGSNVPAPTVDDQVLISTAADTAAWVTAGNNQVLASGATGEVVWENKPFGYKVAAPTVDDQVLISTAAGAASWSTAGNDQYLASNGTGEVAWVAKPMSIPDPTVAGQLYQATGAGSASWTTTISGLTSLTVDNITINGATIISDTGAISFGNEDLNTTGDVSADAMVLSGSVMHDLGANGTCAYSNLLFEGGANTETGTLVIDLPVDFDDTMMSIKIHGYNYTSIGAWSLLIGGYSYGAQGRWLQHHASVQGNPPFSHIRLGYNGNTGKACIMLGATDTVWRYPQIQITNMVAGLQAENAYASGWAMNWYTDETNFYNNEPTYYDPATVAWNRDFPAPSAASQVLQATGDKVAAWSTALTGLTSLTVDNITINGATISSNTGAISFSNENLTTTGSITGGQLTIDSISINSQTISSSSGIVSFADNVQCVGSYLRSYLTTGGIVQAARNDTGIAATDLIGSFEFYTNDASTNAAGVCGAVRYYCDGTWNGVTNEGHLGFYTQNQTSSVSTLVERMTIDNLGDVEILGGDLTLTAGDLNLSSGTLYSDTVKLTQGSKHAHTANAYAYSHVYSKYPGSGTTTGTCVIDLPYAANSTFITIRIRGYTYSSSQSAWEVVIGGYHYNTTVDRWYNFRASVTGEPPFDLIRLGYNGNTGKGCIMLGETTLDWSYPMIEIADVLVSSGNKNGWETGWGVNWYTDETNFYNNDATQTDPQTVSWNRDFNAPAANDMALASTGDKTAAWYTTCLADALKQTVPSASGAERKYVLTAGSGEKFSIESAPWPLALTGNETVYVRTTGNDTTGDGSSGSPFASLERTIEYLGGLYIGDYEVTVDIGEGVFNEAGTLTFQHPFGSQVTFEGVSEQITSQNTNSIGSTGTYLGFNNLYRYDVTFILPVGKSVSVGDYIAVREVSGGTNNQCLYGMHYVSAWNGGTRQATVQVVYRNGAPKASGTVTCTIELVKTVIAFNNKNGMKIGGTYTGGVWKGLVLQGNYNTSNTSAKYGVWALNTGVVSIGGASTSGWAIGVVGFQTGLYAQNNALIFADYGFVSKSGLRCANAQNGGILNLRWARLSGANNNGIFAFNGSTVAANSVKVVGVGNDSVLSYQGSFIDATSAYVDRNNATYSFKADRWSGIDGTSASQSDGVSPTTDGNNDGSYIIGL